MKAMIFAAGMGTRLRPITDRVPKALVNVAGLTLLERNIQKIKRIGITEIVVNVHHFADQIVDFLRSHDNFGITIHISDERDLLLDTGGGVLHAQQWLDGTEPFLIHNVDILTDVDLLAMECQHNKHHALSTLLVKYRDTQRFLLFDENNKLCGWHNKKTGEFLPPAVADIYAQTHEYAFGGIHIMSPKIFPLLQEYCTKVGPKFSIIPFYLSICDQHHLLGYKQTEQYQWLDIGKLETLEQAQKQYGQDC